MEEFFPYVTIVLAEQSWPPVIPTSMSGLSQRVALHLNAASLPKGRQELYYLMEMMDRYDIIVEEDTKDSADALTQLKSLMMQQKMNLYVISKEA